nr:MAG TPA: hypothetical protein [Caudoviricetes sp.]
MLLFRQRFLIQFFILKILHVVQVHIFHLLSTTRILL